MSNSQNIVCRFQHVAVQCADRIAIVSENAAGGAEQLSYQELDRRRRIIAHALRDQYGIGQGDRVGLYESRSPGVLASMLAVASLGATFVPLDPEWPEERRRLIIEDAGVKLSLAASAVDDSPGAVAIESLDAPPIQAGLSIEEDTPLYVMYTSGSTGTPKGVVVPHRAVHRLVVDTDFMELGPDTRFLQLAPQTFDASTLEIWGPLLNGGTCVLYPGQVPDPELVRRCIQSYGVNSMWLTCALFNQFVSRWLGHLDGLSTLLFGGERASVTHVRMAFEGLPATRLINGYGPTENTTFTACHTVRARDVAADSTEIPIGSPIRGTRVRVVSENGESLSEGVSGELLAGGAGLSLGYLNRAELTDARFIRDPGGELWYRTGDLVHFCEDGILHYEGRADRQIKLDGHRIEPGEVETRIMSAADVRQAHVAMIKTMEGSRRLVAYLVGAADEQALRTQLHEALPRYMVPSAFVFMDALPVNANGKVDEAGLPDPFARQEIADEVDMPRGDISALQKVIADIWMQVIGGSARPAPTENFFDVGGSSMDMFTVKEQLDATLKRDIPIVMLFEHPTIEKLAAYLESGRTAYGINSASERANNRKKALSRRRTRRG